MDSSLGASLDQAQNVSVEDMNVGRNISAMNNKNLQDYMTNLTATKTADSHTDEVNLGKLGGYAMGIAEKGKQYKDFMKQADSIGGIKGSKVLYQWPAKAVASMPEAKSIAKGVSAVGEGIADVPSAIGGAVARSGVLGSSAQNRALFEAHAQATTSGGQTEAPSGAEPQTPGQDNTGTGASQRSSSTLEQGGEDVEEGVGAVGKVAKVGGALFSAGMLGDDIFNQVSQKKFFYGDNTGDKVGNFMNEAGSTADVVGLATGDPFLVLAGVGLGAIGSVVSDISELFGHHKKEEKVAAAKPVAVATAPQQNVAGQGGVAETGLSTLKQVQVGAT